ncbi:MAG TPA: MFS transporter [Caulobacteraceae bacterium]|jgi:ACS family hexuronate transporter-like MFS transporter
MTAASLSAGATRAGRFRWVICALLFVAMVFNYVDRQMIGVLKPTLQKEFGWNESAYGDIVFYFQAAYAVSYIGFGRLVDWIGARFGYAVAFVIWTIGHMSHAAVRSASGFIAARVLLGVGEGGGFPAGIKAVSEWFPKRERAFATGLFNAGTNIGAIVTPLIVPFIAIDLAMGWRATFVITGLVGLIWLAAWLLIYRSPALHPQVGAAELALIESDPPEPPGKAPWLSVLRTREAWAYCAGKFLIDPIWGMYLFWLPDFFAKRYHLDLTTFGPPLVTIYLLSDVGSVAGGWLSGGLMQRGFSLNAGRKTAMLVCALAVTPIAFAMYASSLWVAVGIIGLAAAAHQGFSANLYTLPGDVLPRRAVGTVIGVGGAAGAIGGMLMSKYAGWVLDKMGTYTPIFIVAASAYGLALLVIHLLTPRYAPANIA